ncbi:MAG: UMP kinase [Lentisphaeria bacterium]|nr:UMP kinase [Lentisphaeria bacterium]
MESNFSYKRIMLKLSGEALKGSRCHGYEPAALQEVVARIKQIRDKGIEVAVVVGAGNLWRGNMGTGMDRVNADYMGMLATAMNAIAIKEFLNQDGIPAEVYSAINMAPAIKLFDREAAMNSLAAGKIVIFAGGSGSPFFTTDTAAVLKALETGCEIVLKATKVDGIYSADPFKDPGAVRFERISFDEALQKNLKVMDAAAFSLCRDNGLHIGVLNFSDPEALEKLLKNDTSSGTIVS